MVTGHQARLWNLPGKTLLDLTPNGAANTGAWAILATDATHPGLQAGKVDDGAALWRDTPDSYVSLHPAGAIESDAWSLYRALQGGYAMFTVDAYHAALWTGTAGSFKDLHPAQITGVTDSFLRGTASGVQVGNVLFDNDPVNSHAILWRFSTP